MFEELLKTVKRDISEKMCGKEEPICIIKDHLVIACQVERLQQLQDRVETQVIRMKALKKETDLRATECWQAITDTLTKKGLIDNGDEVLSFKNGVLYKSTLTQGEKDE